MSRRFKLIAKLRLGCSLEMTSSLRIAQAREYSILETDWQKVGDIDTEINSIGNPNPSPKPSAMNFDHVACSTRALLFLTWLEWLGRLFRKTTSVGVSRQEIATRMFPSDCPYANWPPVSIRELRHRAEFYRRLFWVCNSPWYRFWLRVPFSETRHLLWCRLHPTLASGIYFLSATNILRILIIRLLHRAFCKLIASFASLSH